MRILRGAPKIFTHLKGGGGSEKIVGLGEGLWNFYYQKEGGAPKNWTISEGGC